MSIVGKQKLAHRALLNIAADVVEGKYGQGDRINIRELLSIIACVLLEGTQISMKESQELDRL